MRTETQNYLCWPVLTLQEKRRNRELGSEKFPVELTTMSIILRTLNKSPDFRSLETRNTSLLTLAAKDFKLKKKGS